MALIQPGQDNGSGNIDALLLKVFGNEVFTAFEENTEMNGLHMIKRSMKGRSATFPVLGKLTASYHTPGDEMFGQATKQTERVITVDKLLVSAVDIYDLDEVLAHYDFRSHYTTQIGRSLALEFDKHILQTAILAAFDVSEAKDFANKNFEASDADAPTLDEVNVDSGDAAFTADIIFGWIKSAQLKFDNRFVPRDQRFMFLRPVDFYTVVYAIHANGGQFYLNPKGPDSGAAAAAPPLEFMLGGMRIRPSNALDLITSSTYFDTRADTKKGQRYAATGAAEATGGMTSTDPYYNAEMANVKAVAFTPATVGTLIHKNMAVETFRDVRRQQDFILGKLAAAHGILNPDTAIVVNDQD